MKQLLFDTDGIGDDILALLAMLAMKDAVQLHAVTTYGRRIRAVKRAQILRSIIDQARPNAGIPVIPGSDVPLMRVPLPGCMHCDQAIEQYCTMYPPIASPDEDAMIAAVYLVELVKQKPHYYSLVCTGPLTNIALALRLDPNFGTNLKEIVVMGGAWRVSGNSSAVAEANFFNDPEAASIVFSSCRSITVVGLDVTLQTALREADIEGLCDAPLAKLTKDIVRSCCTSHQLRGEGPVMPLHDLLALFVVLEPSIVETEQGLISIETKSTRSYGAMLFDSLDQEGRHQWCVSVNQKAVDAYMRRWMVQLYG